MIKKCKKHGDLTEKDIIKKGKLQSGRQAYRCKRCQQELHKSNYQSNKEKIVEKVKKYRADNVEKVIEWKRDYFEKNKERYRERKRENDKNLYAKSREELSDRYIKNLIIRRSELKFNDVPNEFVELKRSLYKLKTGIKKMKEKDE